MPKIERTPAVTLVEIKGRFAHFQPGERVLAGPCTTPGFVSIERPVWVGKLCIQNVLYNVPPEFIKYEQAPEKRPEC